MVALILTMNTVTKTVCDNVIFTQGKLKSIKVCNSQKYSSKVLQKNFQPLSAKIHVYN